MDSNLYRKLSHDLLNITGRMQSVASLLDPADPPSADDLAMMRRVIDQDSHKLNAAIRLFCLGQWLESSPQTEHEEIDISLLLQELVNQHLTNENNPVTLDIQDGEPMVFTSNEILRPLLEELIKNAVAHCAANTAVEVSADFKDGLRIEVINTPHASPPENFTAMMTTRPESPGMGLGLPFALKAATTLGGYLDIRLEDDFFRAVLTL